MGTRKSVSTLMRLFPNMHISFGSAPKNCKSWKIVYSLRSSSWPARRPFQFEFTKNRQSKCDMTQIQFIRTYNQIKFIRRENWNLDLNLDSCCLTSNMVSQWICCILFGHFWCIKNSRRNVISKTQIDLSALVAGRFLLVKCCDLSFGLRFCARK